MPHTNQLNRRVTRNKSDLELGDIKYQAVHSTLSLSNEHLRILGKAVDMRNHIAHLRTVSYDDFIALQNGFFNNTNT